MGVHEAHAEQVEVEGALTLLSASFVEGSLCISHAERMELQSALLQEGMHKPKSDGVPAYETCLKNLSWRMS